MIDLQVHIDPVNNLLLATACGIALGLEREWHNKATGLRTTMLICMGSALFTLASFLLSAPGDQARIAAQIITGVGFLGAGSILRQDDRIAGLTSAAVVWVVAAIGMLAGAGVYGLAMLATVLTIVLLNLLTILERRLLAHASQAWEVELTLPASEAHWLSMLDMFFPLDGPRLLDRQDLPDTDEGVRRLRLLYVAQTRKHRDVLRKLAKLPGVRIDERRAIPMG